MADHTPINLPTAVENTITSSNDAAGRSTVEFTELGTGNNGEKTLTAGIYKWINMVFIPTDVTITRSSTEV